MRGLFTVVAVALSAAVVAAPVPKVAKKTTEQKLLGTWRMLKSDGTGDGPKGYEFYVVFKEKGEFELRYEYKDGTPNRAYAGTFKVIEDDKIDYSVTIGKRVKTEVLTIDKLTDSEVSWTDPDKLREELERVKEK